MRHQYIGVKQKSRVSDDEFNWVDGEDHWVNFSKYKEVFGDVDLDVVSIRDNGGYDEEEEMGSSENGEKGDLGLGLRRGKRLRRNGGMGFVGNQILELRDVLGRREEWRREREFGREEEMARREERGL
ncbi:hypothetical protein GIB67_001968 [Kingdonia uniflora]|uniref:Uncharacterized protein n=1 Tax=Kingdonia uniflora TaxID=39325 RepID=A0A7J7M9X7_9MAGN|nr:hypothetical protein GIB67_001968 [Kingdonia uniflora]